MASEQEGVPSPQGGNTKGARIAGTGKKLVGMDKKPSGRGGRGRSAARTSRRGGKKK